MARQAKFENNAPEKDRLREEIADQVEAFLRSGGKIETVGEHGQNPGAMVGSIWHGQDDPASLLG